MTMAEFETWIETRYGDLLAVARKRVRTDPEDVLQSAVLSMWNSPDLDLRVRRDTTPEERARCFKCPLARDAHPTDHKFVSAVVSVWPWAVGIVRYKAKDSRVSTRRNGTKHLPPHFRGEEKRGRDTRVEGRSKLPKLEGEKRGLKAADDYYLEKLEEDREIFDMEGYGRPKKDKPFEVRFLGDEA